MAKTFKVEVVTPEETAFAAQASALQAPAWEGYLGVLAGHAPMLCVLRSGVLTVRDEAGKPSFFALKGGFMEVTPERVIVLADAVERAEEVNVAEARKTLEAPPAPPEPPADATNEQRRAARAVADEERAAAKAWAEARLAAVERRQEAA